MQHMEWLNASLAVLLCIPLMPLIILFDFNCVLDRLKINDALLLYQGSQRSEDTAQSRRRSKDFAVFLWRNPEDFMCKEFK